jgi:hypothetical protein
LAGIQTLVRSLEELAQEALTNRKTALQSQKAVTDLKDKLTLVQERNQRDEGRLKYELDSWRNLAEEWGAEDAEDFERTLKRYIAQGDIRPWQELAVALNREPKARPEELRKQILSEIEKWKQAADPKPLRELHPSLEKLPSADIPTLVRALSEAISWELSSLWQYLPHDKDESLATPSSRLADLLDRVKAAVIKQNQSPEVRQSRRLLKENQGLIKEITEVKNLLRSKGAIFDQLLKIICNLARDGST